MNIKKLMCSTKNNKINKFQIIDEMREKYSLSSLCLFAKLPDKILDKLFKLKLNEECLIHTDQGSTYTRAKYIQKLEERRITVSMLIRCNCWDNTPIESFFSHLKSESIYLNKVSDSENTKRLVEEYIEQHEDSKKINGLSPLWNAVPKPLKCLFI